MIEKERGRERERRTLTRDARVLSAFFISSSFFGKTSNGNICWQVQSSIEQLVKENTNTKFIKIAAAFVLFPFILTKRATATDNNNNSRHSEFNYLVTVIIKRKQHVNRAIAPKALHS